MKMIKREMTSELLQVAKEYPVVTIIGPRQSGKTTLAKQAFPEHRYYSLEDPDIRRFATEDPRAFLKSATSYAIFDEIQRVPELLSYIQTLVDNDNRKGRYILTGSHQLKLSADISQSLAGRTAILTLLPLTIVEVLSVNTMESKEDFIFNGFFPRIYNDKMNPTRAYANYFRTYVEKDVRQLINLKNIAQFEKFMKLLAGRVGQILNLNSLANDVGTSSTTLKEWISILEASFIIFRLEPYFANFGKRVIKSPKVYFTDTGLLAYLLDIESPQMVSRDPLIGNIFENLVILEILKKRLNQGLSPNLYFFRDSNGHEVDLLFKQGAELTAIEIKSSETFNRSFAKGIIKFQKLSQSNTLGYVVYAGDFVAETEHYKIVNFLNSSDVL